jgi:hypothetical protein
MKNSIRRGIFAAAVALATALGLVGFSGTGAAAAPNTTVCKGPATPSSLQAYGITADGTLMAAFTTDKPDTLNWVRRPSGLVGDTTLIGLDCRVQDGKLYVLGNFGGIYTATVDETARTVTLTKVSQLAVALNGTTFGVDFNPAADRLRVVSDFGQNLRHNLNDHTTVVDTVLTNNGVTAAAYTNNDLNARTVTTLFDINTMTDQVVVQSPANTGQLAPTASLDADATSPVDAAPSAGFDIFSDLNGGRTVSNTGFAALIPASTGIATFYQVDMLTGLLTSVGQFPLQITGIAIQLDS